MIGGSCSLDKKKKVESPQNISPIEIENIYIILENSGSMAGYLNGNQFKKTITDLIADLDKIKTHKDHKLLIKNLSFFTISDNLALIKFSGDAYSFCTAINDKGLAVGKTSPMDDFVKLLVDSAETNTVDLLISDFVIDKKINDFQNFLQGEFNIIFNTARQKNLGVIIYRLTSDFTGNYLPAMGGPQKVKNITRPYFIWMIGPVEQLNLLREKILDSKVFYPENEISFGVPLIPRNVEVLELSNRVGSWRFKDGNFTKAGLKKDNLKFTLAFNLNNLPNYLKEINYLNLNTSIESSSLNILSHKFYSKTDFNSKIHKKEKQKLFDNSHFLEVNISQINSSSNNISISLNKVNQEWFSKFSTDNDVSLSNNNNLNTFMINYIISGIANAYDDLKSNNKYFQLNYKINQ